MKVTALQIRQSLGKILEMLQATDEPIVVEKGRTPVAVLISLKTFRERFVDYREKEKRDRLLADVRDAAQKASEPSVRALRDLRYGPRR